MRLTSENIHEVLHYNPDTGELSVLQHFHSCHVGHVFEPTGRIRVDGQRVVITHVIWFMTHGIWPKNLIDHEDHNCKNNRLLNLREATHQQNQFNKRMPNKTGFKGVVRSGSTKNPYMSLIRINGKQTYLGSFETPEAAHAAYCAAAQEHHGEFATFESK